MARTATMNAAELLRIEEADAWFKYLEDTRGANDATYAEVEPWAWDQLAHKLSAVVEKRESLHA